MRPVSRAAAALCATILVLGLFASSANARTFRMTNNLWIQQRGPNVQIPIFGGIKGADTFAEATGSAPATVTVPANAFTGMNQFGFPLPQTSLVQLTTRFTFAGPTAVGTFSGGAKSTRPANFGWCIGAAANPACTTVQTGGNQGTLHGFIGYTAGPNQFGGTMQMLLTGSGEVSRIVGTAPLRIQHNTIGGGGTGPPLPQVQGGTFANSNSATLPGGPITTGGICAGGICGQAGLITVPGVQTDTGTFSTNSRFGFPWTTGMVSAIVTTMLPTTNSTLTTSGTDLRTPLGAGQLVMVAGGLSNRQPVNATFPATDTVTITYRAQNLPSMSPAGLAALAGMVLLGAGYASRKRWS